MTETELDHAYADLCRTMTRLGEPQMSLYLARFALLAMVEIDDAGRIGRLIAAAAEGLEPAPSQVNPEARSPPKGFRQGRKGFAVGGNHHHPWARVRVAMLPQLG